MLCGDPDLANFVLAKDGSLSMIDPGSFQSDLPIDIFFIGGGLYDAIDRDAFHEAYTHAEGIDFPFRHQEALRLMHAARQCALQVVVLEHTSFLEAKRRRILEARVGEKIAALRAQLER